MAAGMEMMLSSMFRAMGFNPQEFIARIEGFLSFVQGEMKKFTKASDDIDRRLSELQEGQNELRSMLAMLLALHGEYPSTKELTHVAIEYEPDHRNAGGVHVAEHSGSD